MNYADKILIFIAFFAFIYAQAKDEAKRFKQNLSISHFWRGVEYGFGVIVATVTFITSRDWWYALKIPVIGVLERAAIFYYLLNKFRGKVWWYISANGEKPSLIDKLESKLPPIGIKILKIIYLIAFILSIIFIK